MSEQSGPGAADTERELREQEREARERDPDERDPATGVEQDTDARAGKPAPPGSGATGELGGGT
jgi:hypothetical protein